MSDERILSKVQKLLALGESNNQHEAANALAKAQTLMEKYGLNQKAINMSRLGSVESEALVRSMDIPNWYNWFLGSVGRCFGVRCVITRIRGEDHYQWGKGVVTFVGPKDRIELASYCYEVVGRQLLAARKAYNSSLGGMNANRKWKLAEAYCEGWVASINDKIRDFGMTPEEESLCAEYMKDLYNSVGTLKAKEKEYDRDEARALRNGARDGDDISLLRPVGGTETIKIGVNK